MRAATATAEPLEPRRLLATFTVTSTADVVDSADGINTFREAITQSNTIPGVDRIEFNIPGDGPHVIRPTTMLPSIITGCVIDGRTQPGYSGTPIIQIDGALAPASADGLRVGSLASRISGLAITRFGAQGMQITALANQNVIFGNYIGVEPDGVTPAPNARGILLSGFNNVIGGTTAEDRNVISGNAAAGIQINGDAADNNNVRGNYIGTDVTGTVAVGNGTAGVLFSSGPDSNIIGTNGDGTNDASERNVISGNRDIGVRIGNLGTSGNVVAGNYIGTDVTGTAALGNVGWGIYLVDRTSGNRIGTNNDGVSDAAERNVISATTFTPSGQFGDGVKIQDGVSGTVVAGNYIGTDATGTAALGNARWGVMVERASNNQIGRDNDSVADASEGNLISGNAAGGVLIADPSTTGNTFSVSVLGNLIGTDASGAAALGNGGAGVRIEGAVSFCGTFGNAIKHNAGAGVVLAPGTTGRVPRFNSIRLNSIDANGGLGIDLGADGVTPNDYLDADEGANRLTNAPVIHGWEVVEPGAVLIRGAVLAAAFTTYEIEFYATPAGGPGDVPEGARYLGSQFAFTNENGYASIETVFLGSVAAGEIVTATATDYFSSNTSEFSGRVSADPGGPYVFFEGDGTTGGVREIQLNGVAVDLGGDDVSFAWDLDNDGAFDDSTDLDPTLTVPDDGPLDRIVSLRVTNSAGQAAVGTTAVRILNVSPSVLDFTSNSTENEPVAPGEPVVVSGSFTDPGLLDTHKVVVDWGDGTIEELTGAITRPAGSADGTFSVSHIYAAGGAYPAYLNIVDDDGGESGFFVQALVTGAGVQFGTLNVVGTAKSDDVTLTGHDDGSISVAASFLPGTLQFAAGTFFGVNIFLAAKSDRAAATGMIYNLTILAGGGNDVIKGTDAGAYLFGGPGNDTVTGGAGADNIFGDTGNDVLDAGPGADFFAADNLYGDSGNDTLIVHSGIAFVSAGAGDDTYLGGNGSSGNFYGEDGNDKATGGDGPDLFFGGQGNDELNGRGGTDGLYGEGGNDTARGGDGDDALFGGTENDRMEGGAGPDTYYFEGAFNGTEADAVYESGGPAENTLFFGYLYDPADGVIVDLTRSGTSAVRHRNGSRTVNLTGGSTFSTVIGGAGDDLLTGNAADNYIDGLDGNDVILGNGGNDELRGSFGDDEVHGGAGNDSIYGGYGNDRLFGDAGDDFLFGDDFPGGADTIDGGADTDTLGDPGDAADILTSIELP